MPCYRNISQTAWRRASGEAVPPGEVFEATAKEHSRIKRRHHYAVRLVLVDELPYTPPVENEVEIIGGEWIVEDQAQDEDEDPDLGDPSLDEDEDEDEDEEPLDEWILRLTPEKYKELHPTGPNIALAEAHIARAKAEGDA